MEWSAVLQFIEKWWLEFVLGGVGVGLTAVARHYFVLAKKAKTQDEQQKKEVFKQELTSEVKALVSDVRKQLEQEIQDESNQFRELLYKEIEKESGQVREEMAEYETNDGQRITELETRSTILENTLNAVVDNLDIIKDGLLAVQGHEFRNKCRKFLAQEEIKPEDFEQLESDHLAYNKLGGNHKGDSLFEQVKTKYFAQLSK